MKLIRRAGPLRRLRSLLPCLCLLSTHAVAQQLVGSTSGAAGERLGASTLDAGDQNGDGYRDLLVGAPGFNAGRGAVRCISGRYLANGTAPSVLWTATVPSVNAGAGFGTSLVQVGNLTGNSAADFVVGAPNLIPTGAFDTRGAIYLIDGSTHAVVTFIQGLPQTHFGQTMVAVGDQTGDNKIDIAVSAPEVSTSVGSTVHVVPGAAFGFSTTIATISHASRTGGWHKYGAALESGFDYDGDGKFDLAISIPDYGFANPECGYIEVRRANDFGLITALVTGVAGEHFGASIDAGGDYDGDGVIDLIVGAPNAPNGSAYEVGRAVVLSAGRLLAQTPPYELRSFSYGSVTPPVNHSDPQPNFHFGAAVHACADLNNDGVGEILVGAPGYFSAGFPSGWSFRGLVRVYSGATGTLLSSITGGSTDRLGDTLTSSVGDLNGDGFKEFVVTGSLSDAGGTDSGVLKCYSLFPSPASTYCVGKVNSLGCTPTISRNGTASMSSGAPFLVNCQGLLNQKSGLLFYSHAPAATAFQGGIKCVASPNQRTLSMNSGGSATGNDCSGTFSLDFNAWVASGAAPSFVAGSEAFAQYWSRDPASTNQTSLSNALRFILNP
jgi:hypothetical protein